METQTLNFPILLCVTQGRYLAFAKTASCPPPWPHYSLALLHAYRTVCSAEQPYPLRWLDLQSVKLDWGEMPTISMPESRFAIFARPFCPVHISSRWLLFGWNCSLVVFCTWNTPQVKKFHRCHEAWEPESQWTTFTFVFKGNPKTSESKWWHLHKIDRYFLLSSCCES